MGLEDGREAEISEECGMKEAEGLNLVHPEGLKGEVGPGRQWESSFHRKLRVEPPAQS